MRPSHALYVGTVGVIFLWLFAHGQPWRWFWTLGKPMPAIGQTWCRESDGDPWNQQQQRYVVLEVHGEWIRYAFGRADGWVSTSQLWIFRANYAPCP